MITGQSHKTNKHFVVKLISFNSGQLQIREWAITKQPCNYKITLLTMQCRLQSIMQL